MNNVRCVGSERAGERNCTDDAERSQQPTPAKERFLILDALRGFALVGIALANYPEFSLYSFLPDEAKLAMPTADIDAALQFLLHVLVDGKFYSLFSLLFGISFSIIIDHAERRDANGFRIFRRRMALLLCIGLLHLLFLWSGDILALYAAVGFMLPLFRKLTDKGLLLSAAFFLLLPVVVDLFVELFALSPAAWFYGQMRHYCDVFGITEERYAYWLQEQTSYLGTLQFLVQGAFERMTEFIDGNRYFKVMGLFLVGYYVGRSRLYARVGEKRRLLKAISACGAAVGLPLSVLYAWSCTHGHPWGLAMHTLSYTASVFPLAASYASTMALCHLRLGDAFVFKALAAPGRMALSNYLGQTVWGMFLFYGIGLGLGARVGLSLVLPVALAVFVTEAAFSHLWLRHFNYGLPEWLWRTLTYRRRLPLKREK